MNAGSVGERDGFMGFWAELRRRSVFRVAGVYVVVAWVIAQAAAVLAGMLPLPAWFGSVVIALLLLGFPVALVVAWAFELTPEGVRRTPAAREGETAPRGFVAVDAAILAALVAVLAVAVFLRPAGPAPAARIDDMPSIAVLPFADMSPQGDQEYFSDGLSEELLNQLAQLEGLLVISRTSSFAFKGQNADARTIGTALGAGHLLEGSVRKDGDTLRITAQLIDASTGGHVWSKTYDRELRDVFAIQDDIAQEVTDELSATLGVSGSAERIGGTDDPEAYDVFLLARNWRNRDGPDNAARGAELYREAVAIDPEFAQAWLELSLSLEVVAIFATDSAPVIADAQMAADRAVALAPDMWSAHAQQGLLLMYQKDWSGAAQAYARARRIAPADERACIDAPMPFMLGGSLDALLECYLARRRLDPLSVNVSNQLLLAYFGMEDEAAFAAEYERISDLVGPGPLGELYGIFLTWDDTDAAGRRAQMERLLAYGQFFNMPVLYDLVDVIDDDDAAVALLRAAADDPAYQEQNRLSGLSIWLALFGDDARAAELQRSAYLDHGRIYYQTLWEPQMADVRRTEAFKDIVRGLGMRDYWRASGDWGEHCLPVGDDDFECF